jgi:type I restriction enzyme S subunit
MSVWPLVPIKEVARIVGGSTPKSGTAEFWDGQIPWATPKDLSDLNGKFIDDTPRKISQSGLNSCSSELLPPNSVLFSSRAPIGHVAINTVPMATNQGFKSFVPKPKIDASYLYWWLKCHRSDLERLGNGATFKEVSKTVVERIEIPLPPLEDQKRIAAILDQADGIRRKRQHAIERLNQLGQAIFHEMFLDYIENSDTHASLGDISSPKQHKTIPSSALIPDGYPVYGANGQIGYYSEYTHRERTIAITCRGATCGTINISPQTCYITGNAMALDKLDIKRVNLEYLAFALKFRGLGDVISGSAQPQITRGPLQAVRVPIPPLDRQKYFSEKIQHIGDVVEILNKHFSLVSANFQSLQHRAFTGQL